MLNENGAGDIFAGGLMYGGLKGYPLEVSARLANYGGGKAVSHELPNIKIPEEDLIQIARAYETDLDLIRPFWEQAKVYLARIWRRRPLRVFAN